MSTQVDQNSTSQAGQKSNNPIYDPWERIAPEPPTQAVGAPKGVDTPKPKKVLLDPWERVMEPMKKTEMPSLPASSAERALAEQVRLTPAELKREQMINQSPENIAELKAEISRTKDPKSKAILQAELDKLIGKR